MKKTYTFKFIKTMSIALVASLGVTQIAKAQLLEEFEDVTTLTTSGWEMINMSSPVGTTGWFQGNAAAIPLYSMAGYIGANYLNTTGLGTISNWLLSPVLTFDNGDSISFYLSTVDSLAQVNNGGPYPDRIQLLLSTNGSSNDVGTDEFSVGDFSTTLQDINPSYSQQGYPTGFPYVWTQINSVITGLAGPTSGRFALRYFVENGGPSGSNSNYIGIDSLFVFSGITAVNEIDQAHDLQISPNPTKGLLNIKGNMSDKNMQLIITNSLGQSVYTADYHQTLKTQVNLTGLANGVYTVQLITSKETITRKIILQNQN